MDDFLSKPVRKDVLASKLNAAFILQINVENLTNGINDPTEAGLKP